jgi:Lar family restriction alleviation protein
MADLKPCPFCGKKTIECYEHRYGGFFVRCGWCGAEIGSSNNQNEAIEAWNRRSNRWMNT